MHKAHEPGNARIVTGTGHEERVATAMKQEGCQNP